MLASITHNDICYVARLDKPIDISVPISPNHILAWGAPPLKIEPLKQSGWVGDVNRGASVNFNDIYFNPHAHSTHTECVGHISSKKESINVELKRFFFISKLITVAPKKKHQDCVITKRMLQQLVQEKERIDALIIRTLPNNLDKKHKNYSNTNPPYLLKDAAEYLAQINIQHLLIDLPSVDREKDAGRLDSHKLFWQFPDKIRHGCTITELIYVPNKVEDGYFLLNMQFAPFENDASPSRPVLFKLKQKNNHE